MYFQIVMLEKNQSTYYKIKSGATVHLFLLVFLLGTLVLLSHSYVYFPNLQILITDIICSNRYGSLVLSSPSASAFIVQFPLFVFVKRRGWNSWAWVSLRDDFILTFLLELWVNPGQERSACPWLGGSTHSQELLPGRDTGNNCCYYFSMTWSRTLENFRCL